MKYYKDLKKVNSRIMKLRINNLSKEEHKKYKINKFFNILAGSMFLVECFLIPFLILFLPKACQEQVGLMKFLNVIFIILAITMLIFNLILINRFIPCPELPKLDSSMFPEVNRRRLKKYGITDNYIITKCYDSTNPKLINKDVIICISENKLKIINNLYRSIYDFGCYEFNLDEIKYENIKDNNLVKTKITTDKITFVLGHRTKAFIKKNQKNLWFCFSFRDH